ncbi:MAG TPA: YggT family protein [Symbiobacteriaceae bacterium]|nr:YggT family protein [Symbiobacteriaceae bacterium]
MGLIGQTISLFLTVLYVLLLARVLISWFRPRYKTSRNGWFFSLEELTWRATEPMLAPIRRILPQSGMIDFAPLILFFLLRVLQSLVLSIFR